MLFLKNNFLLAQIHALLDLNFFPTLSSKALRYFVCESSRKKLDEFKSEARQLENNLDYFSNSSSDNPLLTEVTSKLDRLKSEIEKYKEKLNELRKLKREISAKNAQVERENLEIEEDNSETEV